MPPNPFTRKRDRPDADGLDRYDHFVKRSDADCASAAPPLRWRDRDAVVASGVGLHAQMVVVEVGGNRKPSSMPSSRERAKPPKPSADAGGGAARQTVLTLGPPPSG